MPIVNIYTPFVTNYTGWLLALPVVILFGLMLGSLGLLLSVYIKQLENVLLNGETRQTRNAETISSFGIRMEFDLTLQE